MRPRISPGLASSERPWRAGWPSYDFQSCCNSIAARAMRIAVERPPRHLKGWLECRRKASRADRTRSGLCTRNDDGLPRCSNDFLSEESAKPGRLRRHPFAVIEHDRLGEVLAPAVLVVDCTTELGLRLPCGRDPAPILRRAEDVLGLREGDEREVEPSGLPVEAREVQERPSAALEVCPVVLPVEPLEGVEQERLRAFRIIPVRGEHAGREERLRDDAGIAGLLRVVQAGIEGAAGVVPATELHQR